MAQMFSCFTLTQMFQLQYVLQANIKRLRNTKMVRFKLTCQPHPAPRNTHIWSLKWATAKCWKQKQFPDWFLKIMRICIKPNF